MLFPPAPCSSLLPASIDGLSSGSALRRNVGLWQGSLNPQSTQWEGAELLVTLIVHSCFESPIVPETVTTDKRRDGGVGRDKAVVTVESHGERPCRPTRKPGLEEVEAW